MRFRDRCRSFADKFLFASLDTRLHLYRKSYYAAISYTDHNIGVIVDKLDTSAALKDKTVVVVFGDHGYQLGEHATWSKMTNFELGVHIPLIIRAPWIASSVGGETAVLAEMVDMYPTLAALAGDEPLACSCIRSPM